VHSTQILAMWFPGAPFQKFVKRFQLIEFPALSRPSFTEDCARPQRCRAPLSFAGTVSDGLPVAFDLPRYVATTTGVAVFGMSQVEFEAALRRFDEEGFHMSSPTMWTAWGQVPKFTSSPDREI
jgi:hypothetical protein